MFVFAIVAAEAVIVELSDLSVAGTGPSGCVSCSMVGVVSSREIWYGYIVKFGSPCLPL